MSSLGSISYDLSIDYSDSGLDTFLSSYSSFIGSTINFTSPFERLDVEYLSGCLSFSHFSNLERLSFNPLQSDLIMICSQYSYAIVGVGNFGIHRLVRIVLSSAHYEAVDYFI